MLSNKVSPPITLLQEICAKNSLTPDYQLLSTEGSVHEPTFKIAVTVGDISAIASGQSKKKARHAAAREAIDKLRQKPDLIFDGINFDALIPVDESPDNPAIETSLNEPNPVGKLQEICMKMRVNPPDYDTCDEKGLAHERVFFLSCSIASLNLATMGQGKSKKLAKRQAAELMLAKLENSGIYEKTSSGKKVEQNADSLHIDADDNSFFVNARRQLAELTNNLDLTVSDLWNDVKMIEEDNVNEVLFYDLFYETISSVGHHFEIEQLTTNACILHVKDEDNKVVMTSFGSGSDISAAMKFAVIKAYQQIMTFMRPLAKKSPLL